MNTNNKNMENKDKFKFTDLLLLLSGGLIVFGVQAISDRFFKQPDTDDKSQQNTKTEVIADSIRNDTVVQHVFRDAKQLKR